ncbi:MAG: hypothetical protein ABIR19_03205, partial [Ginsengibacter sp.]
MKIRVALLHVLFIVPLIYSPAQQLLAQAKPISLHPVNPHYFLYKNNPLIMVTSGEHYGAVINTDF